MIGAHLTRTEARTETRYESRVGRATVFERRCIR